MGQLADAFAWRQAVAYARADLVYTVEAIGLLAVDVEATVCIGRWMGDTERAIERACGHEAVDQLAGLQVGYLLDIIRAGHPKGVEVARVVLIATLPDL